MNEEQVIKVAKVLEEWNPLGEEANTVEQLDGYRYEAIDIISAIQIVNGPGKIKESIEQVLTQAFNVDLNKAKLEEATKRIKDLLSL
jgi:hypothetical protein